MNQLTNSARKIDVVFKILDILFKVAVVICLVGLIMIAVGVIFDLPKEMAGFNNNQIDLGPVTFQVAEAFTPDFFGQLGQVAIMLALAAGLCFIGILSVRCIRAILQPMKMGQPFSGVVSRNLRKLGVFSLILGVMQNVTQAVSLFTIARMQQIETLLISEKITHVGINYSIDLDFLVVAAIIFLLAYVFRYGEELQTLSDETL